MEIMEADTCVLQCLDRIWLTYHPSSQKCVCARKRNEEEEKQKKCFVWCVFETICISYLCLQLNLLHVLQCYDQTVKYVGLNTFEVSDSRKVEGKMLCFIQREPTHFCNNIHGPLF